MSELPQGWINAEFGKLNQFSSKNIDPSEYSDEVFELYSVPIFPTGKPELSLGKDIGSTKQQVQPGDVLVCKINPRINRVWVVGEKTKFRQIASSEWIVIRAERHDPRFLGRYFSSREFRELLCTDLTGVGGSLTRAQPKRVATYEIPIAPRAEQKRIADKLDALLARVDATRERLDRIPTLLKRLRQSVLAAATSGQLTEDWRHEQLAKASLQSVNSVHHRTDVDQFELQERLVLSMTADGLLRTLVQDHESVGGHARGNASEPTEDVHNLTEESLPKGWKVVALRDLCIPGRPITYGILKPGPELENGIPYIRVADFPGNKLNLSNIKKTSSEIDEQFRRSRLIAGDLLLSIRGSVGRLIEIPPELDGANITQDTARLSISKRISSRYVYFGLLSEDLQGRMRAATRGVAVRGINIGDVRALQVPLPCRLEQDEIVRRVELLFELTERLEVRYAAARARVEKLTPALLAKAFRGELVPQDPSDEPAKTLLERIRFSGEAKPAASGKGGKSRQRRETV